MERFANATRVFDLRKSLPFEVDFFSMFLGEVL